MDFMDLTVPRGFGVRASKIHDLLGENKDLNACLTFIRARLLRFCSGLARAYVYRLGQCAD